MTHKPIDEHRFDLLHERRKPHPWSQTKQWVVVTTVCVVIAAPFYVTCIVGIVNP